MSFGWRPSGSALVVTILSVWYGVLSRDKCEYNAEELTPKKISIIDHGPACTLERLVRSKPLQSTLDALQDLLVEMGYSTMYLDRILNDQLTR